MAERDDEIDRLRDELSEWRRRAEVAEAVAAERLARAETAERAVRAAEAALAKPGAADPPVAQEAPGPRRPGSLIERWRRYTETIN